MSQGQPYLAFLYCSLFAAGYYGLLRVGEMTSGQHPVLATDVFIASNKKKLKFILYTSKTHWRDERPQVVQIMNRKNPDSDKNLQNKTSKQILCPYFLLRTFSKMRPTCRDVFELFFVFSDRSSVKLEHMRNVLYDSLQKAAFNPALYGTHSLRSGAASDLLDMGFSVETIKKLGRWKSNSVYIYLK